MACAKPPPMGLCAYPSSRAIYAIDLMLKWDSHPDGKGTLHTRTFHPGQRPAAPGTALAAVGFLIWHGLLWLFYVYESSVHVCMQELRMVISHHVDSKNSL